jgi:hypothetical protein
MTLEEGFHDFAKHVIEGSVVLQGLLAELEKAEHRIKELEAELAMKND